MVPIDLLDEFRFHMSIKWVLPWWLEDPTNCCSLLLFPLLFSFSSFPSSSCSCHFPHGGAGNGALCRWAPLSHVQDGSLACSSSQSPALRGPQPVFELWGINEKSSGCIWIDEGHTGVLKNGYPYFIPFATQFHAHLVNMSSSDQHPFWQTQCNMCTVAENYPYSLWRSTTLECVPNCFGKGQPCTPDPPPIVVLASHMFVLLDSMDLICGS